MTRRERVMMSRLPPPSAIVPVGPEIDSPSSSRLKRWASEADWVFFRPLITHLYQEKGVTLRDLMHQMEKDHDFFATLKMYKSRMRAWGIGKNLSGRDVAAILCKKKQRDAVGKPSTFFLRGSKVKWKNVQRHIDRYPSILIAMDSPDLDDLPQLECRTRTPSPEPPSDGERSDPSKVAADISVIVQSYVRSALSMGIWAPSEDGRLYGPQGQAGFSTLDRWTKQNHAAVQYLTRTNGTFDQGETAINLAFRIIGQANGDFQSILEGQDPLTLINMLKVILYHSDCHHDLRDEEFRYVGGISSIHYGAHHPIAQILGRIQDAIDSVGPIIIQTALQCMLFHFEGSLGISNLTTADIMMNNLGSIRADYAGQRSTDPRFLVGCISASLGRRDKDHSISLCLQKCDILVDQNRDSAYTGATEQIAKFLLNNEAEGGLVQADMHRRQARFHIYCDIARWKTAQGEYLGARRQVYEMTATHLSGTSDQVAGTAQSSVVLDDLLCVAYFLDWLGETHTADEMRKEWKARVSQAQEEAVTVEDLGGSHE